jgi:hypothetical protein
LKFDDFSLSEKKWLTWATQEDLALEKMPIIEEGASEKSTVEKWLFEVGFVYRGHFVCWGFFDEFLFANFE